MNKHVLEDLLVEYGKKYREHLNQEYTYFRLADYVIWGDIFFVSHNELSQPIFKQYYKSLQATEPGSISKYDNVLNTLKKQMSSRLKSASNIGLLFSGGLDSLLLGVVLHSMGLDYDAIVIKDDYLADLRRVLLLAKQVTGDESRVKLINLPHTVSLRDYLRNSPLPPSESISLFFPKLSEYLSPYDILLDGSGPDYIQVSDVKTVILRMYPRLWAGIRAVKLSLEKSKLQLHFNSVRYANYFYNVILEIYNTIGGTPRFFNYVDHTLFNIHFFLLKYLFDRVWWFNNIYFPYLDSNVLKSIFGLSNSAIYRRNWERAIISHIYPSLNEYIRTYKKKSFSASKYLRSIDPELDLSQWDVRLRMYSEWREYNGY